MICQQGRVDCFAFMTHGRCTALSSTDFDKDCPFYKSRIQVRREQNASIDRLERLGRFDLLDKYTNQDKRNRSQIAIEREMNNGKVR